MRVRKVKNVQEKLEQYEGLLISNPRDYKGKWKTLFCNDNPIYLEIGMGKGKFIYNHAKLNLEINYLGLEKDSSIVCKALVNNSVDAPSNLKYICIDATYLKEIFEDNEVKKVYLNFSDPWPKTRHEKRRLTSKTFLNDILDILDGTIEFKTDNRHLFEYSIMEFNQMKLEILDLSLDLHQDKENVITTEYEDKFMQKGNVIYYCEVKR